MDFLRRRKSCPNPDFQELAARNQRPRSPFIGSVTSPRASPRSSPSSSPRLSPRPKRKQKVPSIVINDDNYTLDIGEEGENYPDESLPLPSASTSEGSPRGDMDDSNVVTGYRGNSWVFENKLGVAEDLRYLSHMPELCDVTFLVGETREPICAVRAILAARSRIFHKLLYSAARGTSRKKNVSTTDKLGKRVSQMIRRSSIDLGEDYSALSGPRTIVIEEFDPSVFHQLIQYCHTGCVTLKPKIVLGLMNASDHYGLDELRRACMTYLQNCVNIDTVCLLLRSAEKYIQYKSTKSLVQKALEFVDINAESVLRLPAFTALPNHVARLILSRDELQADELTKFQAALAWSRAYMEKHPSSKLRDVMTPFIDSISFHLIPATTLMQSVKPTGAVPDQKIMTALAYQADPSSIEPGSIVTTPARLRLSMLSLNVHDSPTPTDRLSRTDNSSSSIKSATSYASLNTSRSSGIDKLPLDNEPDNEPDNPELGNRTLDLDDDFDPETCHNNNSSGYIENGDRVNGGDDDEEEEEEDNSDERHDHVDLMFTQDRCFSPPCLSDTNTSCSMSVCSDWTDTSSSAGGSFGRADQKESNFKLLVTE